MIDGRGISFVSKWHNQKWFCHSIVMLSCFFSWISFWQLPRGEFTTPLDQGEGKNRCSSLPNRAPQSPNWACLIARAPCVLLWNLSDPLFWFVVCWAEGSLKQKSSAKVCQPRWVPLAATLPFNLPSTHICFGTLLARLPSTQCMQQNLVLGMGAIFLLLSKSLAVLVWDPTNSYGHVMKSRRFDLHHRISKQILRSISSLSII